MSPINTLVLTCTSSLVKNDGLKECSRVEYAKESFCLRFSHFCNMGGLGLSLPTHDDNAECLVLFTTKPHSRSDMTLFNNEDNA